MYICENFEMNTFDIIIGALLLFGFVRGLFKGLLVEIASLVALIAGIYGAIHFSYSAGNILDEYVAWDEKYLSIVSFAITFIFIVIVIALMGKMLTQVANLAALGFLNKLLGGVFGGLKIGLILSVVLIVFTKLNDTIPFISDAQKEESVLYEPVKNLAPTLFPDFLKIVSEETDELISN